MRKVKFVIYGILLMFSLIILGELYVFSLDSFVDEYINCTFDIYSISDIEKTKIDFIKTAGKHKVGIFALDNKIPSERNKEYHIYGNEIAIKNLKEKRFSEVKYNSLVVGESNIYFHDFNELNNSELFDRIYFTNGKNDIQQTKEFKKELIGEYGGGFPHYYGKSKTIVMSQILVFIIVYLLLLLLTMFELQNRKKESFIRLVQGEDILEINLRLFIKDQLFLILITIFLYIVFKQIHFITFLKVGISIAFLIQFIISLIIYITSSLSVEHGSLKKINEHRAIIISSYIIKLIILVFLFNILYANGLLIRDGYEYRKQKVFFDKHKDYHYYQLNYKIGNNLGKDKNSVDDSARLHRYLNEKHHQDSLLMFNFSKSTGDMKTIIANKHALEAQNIRLNSEGADFNKTDLIIYYKDKISDQDSEMLKDILKMYYPETIEIEFKPYHHNVELLAINDAYSYYRSEYIKNPYIIYEPKIINFSRRNENARLHFAYSIPYRLTEQEFSKVIDKYQLENQIKKQTNIYERYISDLKNINRNTILLLFISLLFIILNMIIISYIIRMQYFINRKELVLKTILGYSVVEKSFGLINIQILFVLVGIITVLVLNGILERFNLMVFGIISIILITQEVIVIYSNIKKNERILLSHVIKGGE